MEEKIEKLRNAIKSNPNLSEEFKCNVGTLTDLIVTVFPQYDYTYMENILSSLNVTSNDEIGEYSSYDRDTNLLSFNTGRIFDDRIDMQHLFLNEILKASTTTTIGYEGFKEATTESICSLMNEDDSMKKLNPEGQILISIFSKILDPEVIISSYMNGSVVDIIENLGAVGITKEDFDNLAISFNGLRNTIENNTSFTNAEIQMIDMYRKLISTKMENKELDRSEASKKFADFSTLLIYGRSELISLYPHHDFSNVSGFENVEKALSEAVTKLESLDEVLDISTPVK